MPNNLYDQAKDEIEMVVNKYQYDLSNEQWKSIFDESFGIIGLPVIDIDEFEGLQDIRNELDEASDTIAELEDLVEDLKGELNERKPKI